MKKQLAGGLFGVTDNYGANYYTNASTESTTSKVATYVLYIGGFLVLTLILLVIVHYTIKPIFRFKPGDPGVIGVPGTNPTSEVYWTNTVETLDLTNPRSFIYDMPYNYSFGIDILVTEPTVGLGQRPRILLYRANNPITSTDFDDRSTIQTLFTSTNNFNFIVYLDGSTNDLNISTATFKEVTQGTTTQTLSSIETVTIPNIPVNKSIRLTVGLAEQFMEVYVNGYLVKSRTYQAGYTLPTVKGKYIYPTPLSASPAKVKNLTLWNQILPASFYRVNGTPSATIDTTIIPSGESQPAPPSGNCLA
jgi:hypothetical protein